MAAAQVLLGRERGDGRDEGLVLEVEVGEDLVEVGLDDLDLVDLLGVIHVELLVVDPHVAHVLRQLEGGRVLVGLKVRFDVDEVLEVDPLTLQLEVAGVVEVDGFQEEGDGGVAPEHLKHVLHIGLHFLDRLVILHPLGEARHGQVGAAGVVARFFGEVARVLPTHLAVVHVRADHAVARDDSRIVQGLLVPRRGALARRRLGGQGRLLLGERGLLLGLQLLLLCLQLGIRLD